MNSVTTRAAFDTDMPIWYVNQKMATMQVLPSEMATCHFRILSSGRIIAMGICRDGENDSGGLFTATAVGDGARLTFDLYEFGDRELFWKIANGIMRELERGVNEEN